MMKTTRNSLKCSAPVSENELLSRLAAGDLTAWSDLAHLYGDDIRITCSKVLRNRYDVEDAVQETLLKIHQYAASFDIMRHDALAKGWIMNLARWEAIKVARRRERYCFASFDSARAPECGMSGLEQQETGIRLRAALDALPSSQRIPIMLYYREGLTQSEIASRFKRDQSTIHDRIQRGLERLRHLMQRPARAGMMLFAVTALVCCAAKGEENFDFRTKYIRDFNPHNTNIVCKKVERAPKLDGTFNDPLWQQAGKNESAFTLIPQQEVCGRQTVVYLCYDTNALYAAFDCEEKELDQQQIDAKDIRSGDHVSLHIEVGDYRGRGQRFFLHGNRAGCAASGDKPLDYWRQFPGFQYKCVSGPNRWIAQFAIPFKGFSRVPVRGEAWGVKLVRYGRTMATGALRMRSSWPHIPTPTENTVLHNGRLYFDTDNILTDGEVAVAGGKIKDFEITAGSPAIDAANWSAAEEVTLAQKLQLPAGNRFSLEWTAPGGWQGSVAASAKGKELSAKPLSYNFRRLDFQAPADSAPVEISLKLKGSGPRPAFRLSFLLDDVPLDWICLTNNDWLPERNLNNRLPKAAEGAYTYLKSPLYGFGYNFYRDQGCDGPKNKATAMGQGAHTGDGYYSGSPVREPLERAVARPDIGEDEFENFPLATIGQDREALPDLVGLPSGSFEKGGDTGWIAFSKGSLTGDESWVGWPTNRWSAGVPHEIILDFKEKYFIRRVDILQPESGFRNFDFSVRGSDHPADSFIPIFRANGPGTGIAYPWPLPPAYFSARGLDSVARQLRMFLGTMRGDGGMEVGGSKMFGIAEVWVWAEPQDKHADTDVKAFKVVVAAKQPPLQCAQLQKLPEPVIWPRPKTMKREQGRFEVTPETPIVLTTGGMLQTFGEQLQGEVLRRFCVTLPLKKGEWVRANERAIWLGIKSLDPAFDQLCKERGLELPAEPQGYALKVSHDKVIVAGIDVEGLFNGIQSLLQWADHDEQVAFLRNVSISDWPRLKLRTVMPSTDHRQPIMPLHHNDHEYYWIVNSLARLRYNALSDHHPASGPANCGELIGYAADRMIEVRPVLSGCARDWPGECLEADPDDAPAVGHIGTADGTFETGNLCPSNPRTYEELEKYLDAALTTHSSSQYVDVALMGSHAGLWNVCKHCRQRHLSGGQLYAEFLNRIAQMCAKHGKIAVLTNAFMFSNDPQHPEGNRGMAEAFGLVSRTAMLRIDRNMDRTSVVEGGFWKISRSWDSPWALRDPYYRGGELFEKPLPPDMPVEGMLHIGEACNWWWWSMDLSHQGLWAAEEFWNAQAPDRSKDKKEACDEFEQTAVNACVRYNEQIVLQHEYPSWRTGMQPKFFTVDIRSACTRSHIDEGAALGAGHSGPREGMLGLGAEWDFRRVPTGAQTFAGVPFEIIDPEQNGWKSMILVGDSVKANQIPGSVTRAEIPIGKKAASLCALRCLVRKENVSGGQYDFFQLMLPGYVFQYADGTRYVCDTEQIRFYNDVQAQCFRFAGLPYGIFGSGGAAVGGPLRYYMWPTTRIALETNTLDGHGVNLFLNEFVNPYPDKEIKSLIVQFPNPEQKACTYGLHDVIMAVTGVEPTAWDAKFWQSRPPLPLLPPEPALPAQAAPLLKNLERRDTADGETYHATGGKQLVVVKRPKQSRGQLVQPCQITFDQPVSVAALEVRLNLPEANYDRSENPMPVAYKHADVHIQITSDGKDWQETEVRKGCTGMDGGHVFLLPEQKLTGIKILLDDSAYKEQGATGIRVLALEIYEHSDRN
jgi:RNA polymerase sigma-70 factor (ECF subfamily)